MGGNVGRGRGGVGEGRQGQLSMHANPRVIDKYEWFMKTSDARLYCTLKTASAIPNHLAGM